MALSGTRQGVFEELERWHRRTFVRLNSVQILYGHFRLRSEGEWPAAVTESICSLRDQLRLEGEIPGWVGTWFSSAAEEESTTFARVSSTSAHRVAFELTNRMLSVGASKSFVGMLEPEDSLLPLMTLVRAEFSRAVDRLDHVSSPNEIISLFCEEERPSVHRPQRSRVGSRNSRAARLKKQLRMGVFRSTSSKPRS
jgi:hypothetical protein